MAPKRQWLAERVAEEVRKDMPLYVKSGGRLPSVRNLADRLGVCVETERAAQRILAAGGVLEIRHGSGVYVVEGGTSSWVGIYTDFNILQPRAAAFHVLTPHFLREFLSREGVDAEVYVGSSRPGDSDFPPGKRFAMDARNGRLSGVAILTAPPTREWSAWVAGLAIPAVGVHTPYQLDARYGEMVDRAVRLLHQQGARRIAMLSWAHEGLEKHYVGALADCGLEYRPEWVRCDLHPMLTGAGWEEFREIWAARQEKPDGLLVTDDLLFDEVQVAVLELGIRVPGQLRIVTHANKDVQRRYPFPVTLAVRDTERYARELGKLLLKRMRNEPMDPSAAAFPFEIVENPGVVSRVSPPVDSPAWIHGT